MVSIFALVFHLNLENTYGYNVNNCVHSSKSPTKTLVASMNILFTHSLAVEVTMPYLACKTAQAAALPSPPDLQRTMITYGFHVESLCDLPMPASDKTLFTLIGKRME
ncbi:hypothetical protein MHU86_22305 [Fragilaria crotonensis]|nr:hypothetical protein MHU86_22305 [Fragilaria crotonensis]